MNAGTNRSLKDYGSLLAYLIPCSLVIAFTHVILLPRFERVAEEYGADIPGAVAMMVNGFQFFFNHFWLVLPILLAPIIIAESYSGFWKSKRRAFLGVLQWLVVFSTMIALVALGTAALALL